MNVFEVIKKRRSIRSYLDQEVDRESILKLLAAACQAPSASNRQEWRFVVVQDKETKSKLSQAAKGQDFVREAPLVLACCAKTDNHLMTCGQACYPIDIAIAVDHITLAAVELGLGTCWVGAFYEKEVKQILEIPQDIRVVELLTVGFAKKYPSQPKNRLGLKEITYFEKWGNPGA
jgi:nitroreductase